MVIGKKLHGSSHGEHRIVLEAGVQYFGARLHSDPGERGKGQGAARQEDRSEGLSMVGGSAATWISPGEFHSAARYTGVTGFDAKTSHSNATGGVGAESRTKAFRRRQRENWQRVEQRVRHVGTSHDGGITGQGNDGRRDG